MPKHAHGVGEGRWRTRNRIRVDRRLASQVLGNKAFARVAPLPYHITRSFTHDCRPIVVRREGVTDAVSPNTSRGVRTTKWVGELCPRDTHHSSSAASSSVQDVSGCIGWSRLTTIYV